MGSDSIVRSVAGLLALQQESFSHGYYWSSVPGSDYYYYDNAWYLDFYSSGHSSNYYYYRYYGQSVRPVQGFTK